jgi:hypothetical protein
MEEAPEGATDQWRSEALEIRFHEHYSDMKRSPSTGEITLNEDRYVLVRAKGTQPPVRIIISLAVVILV